MSELLFKFREFLQPSMESLRHWVDVLVVGFLIYRFLLLVRSTRAWRILLGVVIFVIALFVSDLLGLRTLHWMLEKGALLGPVALVILFLPELRQALEGFGKLGGLSETTQGKGLEMSAHTVEELVAAVSEMASTQTGAILVLEHADHLVDTIQNGVVLDAEVTAALVASIFYEGNPLHDGAVIVRGNRILAAACRLPLSDSTYIDKRVHMRHRAGLGISEQSDALTLIVSEERGTISIAHKGSMTKVQDASELRDRLRAEFIQPEHNGEERPRRRRGKAKVEA